MKNLIKEKMNGNNNKAKNKESRTKKINHTNSNCEFFNIKT